MHQGYISSTSSIMNSCSHHLADVFLQFVSLRVSQFWIKQRLRENLESGMSSRVHIPQLGTVIGGKSTLALYRNLKASKARNFLVETVGIENY